MTASSKRRRAERSVDVSGVWVKLPLEFLAGRAFARLSPVAVKMLFFAMGQLKAAAYGNGRIDLSKQRLRAGGWTSDATAYAAICELIDANLLVRTLQGAKGRLALYAVSLWPIHCDHRGLEVGPGGWTINDWRAGSGDDHPTPEKPVVWNRPRRGVEKREASSRRGNASAKCDPAAGTEQPTGAAGGPAAGAQTLCQTIDALPLRELPLELPSARASSALPHRTRMGVLLARRTSRGLSAGYWLARGRLVGAGLKT